MTIGFTRLVLAGFFLPLLAGCVTSRSELLGSSVFPPRPDGHDIIVYDSLDDVEVPFTKVGVVHCEGRPRTKWDTMMAALKVEARKIGADALILRDESGGDRTGVVLFTGSGPVYGAARNRKNKSCLAVRFDDDAPQDD